MDHGHFQLLTSSVSRSNSSEVVPGGVILTKRWQFRPVCFHVLQLVLVYFGLLWLFYGLMAFIYRRVYDSGWKRDYSPRSQMARSVHEGGSVRRTVRTKKAAIFIEEVIISPSVPNPANESLYKMYKFDQSLPFLWECPSKRIGAQFECHLEIECRAVFTSKFMD